MDLKQPDNLRKTTIGIVAAIVLIAGTLGIFWSMRSSSPPDVNGDLLTVARFVNSSSYQRLDDISKTPFMKRLRKSSDELKAAFLAGKLTRREFDEAYLNGWMARQLDHMEEYYSHPAQTRDSALMARYRAEAAVPRPVVGKPSGPKVDDPSDDVKDSFVRDRVRTWPVERRDQWEAFRTAVKAAKSATKTPAPTGMPPKS